MSLSVAFMRMAADSVGTFRGGLTALERKLGRPNLWEKAWL